MVEPTKDELLAKYAKRLGEITVKGPKDSYSLEYKRFRRAGLSGAHTFYEGLCNGAIKIFKPKLKPDEESKLKTTIELAHLDITPQSAVALGYLTGLLVIFFGSIIALLLRNLFLFLAPLLVSAVIFYYVPRIPDSILKRWRVAASDQLVLATLYLVLYMKREPNLERAVFFVAKHTSPPIALDFMRVLWQFETAGYSTVNEALDKYVETWRGREDEFVEGVHLVEASLFESNKKKADEMLDKSVDVVLEGVQDHMLHYAHALQGPVQAIHMLGIVLPVLTLVMLPLMTAFMQIPGLYVLLLFDVVLPITVFSLARNALAMRPGGLSKTSPIIYTAERESRPKAFLGGIGVFSLFVAPVAFLIMTAPEAFDIADPTIGLYLSLTALMGIGFSMATYYWLDSREAIKIKRGVEKVEDEFSSATFQLGSRIDEGVPTELAFSKVAEGTKGLEVSKMFSLIDYNLRMRGMSLKEAIFNERTGAVHMYPSTMIGSTMQLIVEGAKKSLKAVADSLMVISEYLKNVHRVIERLKDLLADTLSEMSMQASYFISLIAGIIVSLSTLIIQIMSKLGVTLAEIQEATTLSAAGVAIPNFNIFSTKNAMPTWEFQLVVAIYVLLMILILSYLISGIVNGADRTEARYLMAKNLFKGTIVYSIVTFVATMILSQIAFAVTGAL